ncbi:MAG TPA: sigma-70 family RNA polymerase sigma factor, partial [Blastocatellia bacterium]|nr:sigma-70 family RNA polymerase sigma factor [Blastocatellia bacterium]
MVVAETLETDRRLLWGLCYRMTGNAADADDLVQETFVRALENPPRRLDEPLRPWLVRVAINLSRDLLRKRRRRAYAGEWLPTPVPTEEAEDPASYEPPAPSEDSPAARYDMIESISMAFLLALEALTPTARAVLLLRDVFDYSTEETAEAIGISEANVKVHLHRARRRMAGYDKQRAKPGAGLTARTRRALEEFLYYLGARNAEGLEKLLTEDAISISDGGGEVAAAMRQVRGRSRVTRLVLGLAEKVGVVPSARFISLNGLPAVLLELD